MKQLHYLLLGFILISGNVACKKDSPDQTLRNGTYTGTFTVRYQNSVQTTAASLTLANGRFSCTNNFVPGTGSGTFSYTTSTLSFQDEGVWTANFDWNLILNGDYSYTFDGKTLRFSADKNDVGNYSYELVLQ